MLWNDVIESHQKWTYENVDVSVQDPQRGKGEERGKGKLSYAESSWKWVRRSLNGTPFLRASPAVLLQ